MSPPLLIGNIQLPFSSMDSATTASRGSPLVLKSVNPKKGSNTTAEIKITANSGMLFLILFITR